MGLHLQVVLALLNAEGDGLYGHVVTCPVLIWGLNSLISGADGKETPALSFSVIDGGHSYPFYRYPYMSKVAFGALLFCTNLMNAPSKEGMKSLTRILFIC